RQLALEVGVALGRARDLVDGPPELVAQPVRLGAQGLDDPVLLAALRSQLIESPGEPVAPAERLPGLPVGGFARAGLLLVDGARVGGFAARGGGVGRGGLCLLELLL